MPSIRRRTLPAIVAASAGLLALKWGPNAFAAGGLPQQLPRADSALAASHSSTSCFGSSSRPHAVPGILAVAVSAGASAVVLKLCGRITLRALTARDIAIPEIDGDSLEETPQSTPACSAPAWRNQHWFPVASTLELDEKRPTPVRIDGLDLVVWKVPGQKGADEGWRVMLDQCPHRLAPLSEGRIEEKTGCLQCAYHGWEFDSCGSCTKIPQVEEGAAQKMRENPRSRVRSFPTRVGLKLVWVWLGEGSPKGEPRDIASGTRLESEFQVFGTYTRDLPYGYDSLIENLIDVSHVPFAHHGLQGSREDAMPVTMTIPSVRSEGQDDILHFTFGDRTMGMTRQASFSLRSPFFFFYLGEFVGDKTGDYEKFAARRGTDGDKSRPFRLNIACVPVSPGWSRVIIMDAAVPGNEGIRGMIPPWVTHLLSNRFLDSDLAFLHYQERNLRKAPNSAADWANSYFMPGESDRSIGAWRQWLAKEGAYCVSPDVALPPSASSREQLLNRFEQHTMHCKHCREALDGINSWQRGLGVAGLVALVLDHLALGPAQLWLATEVLAILAVAALQVLKQEFQFKDYEHYKT